MKYVAYALRLLWFAYAVYSYFARGAFDTLNILIIFTATVPVLYFATKERRAYTIDVGISLVFLLSYMLPLLGMPLVSDVIGIDKLFHLAAGIVASYAVLVLFDCWQVKKYRILLWLVLCLVIFIGWETFEWFEFLFKPDMALTIIDSVGDVIAGLIGAAIVYLSLASTLLTRS